ncbi:Uncharacterised protein [Vibrio cholerae]|nr:Uncharacterised protein [Vibrio cholerae]
MFLRSKEVKLGTTTTTGEAASAYATICASTVLATAV